MSADDVDIAGAIEEAMESSAAESRQAELGGAWPSPSNSETALQPGERPDFSGRDEKAEWLVEQFREQYPERAERRVSAGGADLVGDAREFVSAVGEGDTVSEQAVKWWKLLEWFVWREVAYTHQEAEFVDADGEEFHVPLNTSFAAENRSEHYAKIKGIERQMRANFDNPHTAMLTFTQSHRNGRGEWRCPADHEQETREGVKRALERLRSTFNESKSHLSYNVSGKVDKWTYALVSEPHSSGYVHWHLAIFVDGEVERGDFERTMRAYCDEVAGAKWEVHRPDGFACDEHGAPQGDCYECSVPVSVREVGEDADNDEIENVGSYVGAYLGMGQESDVLDRPVEELAAYAILAARRGQKVRFSENAREMYERDWELGGQEAWNADEWVYEDIDSGDDGGEMVENGRFDMIAIVRNRGDPDEERMPPATGGPEPLEQPDGLSANYDPPRRFEPPD